MRAISKGVLADGRKIRRRRGEKDKLAEIEEAASCDSHPYFRQVQRFTLLATFLKCQTMTRKRRLSSQDFCNLQHAFRSYV